MPEYVYEIECSCGGYVGELFCIDTDMDGDDLVRTVRGVCVRCGKEYVYKEQYILLGCYDIKEQ